MALFSWRKIRSRKHQSKQQNYREFLRRWTHRPRIERLEDRITPSAEALISGITATMTNNFDAASDKFLSLITTNGNVFDTPIPGVLQTNHDITGNGKIED